MDEIAREDPSLSAVERETVATGIEADLETEPAPASATQLAATGELAALGEQELADAGELHALELADAGELAALGGQGQEAVDPGAEELAASCSKRKRVRIGNLLLNSKECFYVASLDTRMRLEHSLLLLCFGCSPEPFCKGIGLVLMQSLESFVPKFQLPMVPFHVLV